MKRFEDLEVYQKAFEFSIKIYKITSSKIFDSNIKNQIQRAVLSIPLNIAEGFELQSNKQFVKFLYISKGSSGEVRSLLRICERLEYLESKNVQELIIESENISKQLSKFINYLKRSEIY
ncbi:four helix bundle protein [Polaribacter sp. Hel1_85]|uniref:four helix bundle protein n=1 Tax=Polaribacter sp. Hel1_85 TaxID=1250005 RepID=UPI00052CBAF5|nr:four helix bundle protein [Polaribacter sp. Hel1_85]KGL62371.1 S23 ribosomal protein [Polaribacter sp. Hel1_85]